MAELLGVPAESLAGRAVQEAFPTAEVYGQALEALAAVQRNERPEIKISVLHSGGSLRWCRMIGQMLDKTQPERGTLWVLEDITQRVADEAARDRLKTAVEQADEAIVITDTKGNIQFVNPAFERVTGYSCAEAVGGNPRLLKSGKHGAALYKDLWSAISSGRPWKGRLVNRRKDGALFTEEATISPVFNGDGHIVNYVAVKHDITARLHLETGFLQAQKLESVGRLAAGVAHEINTPVQFVSDSVQWLSEGFRDLAPLLESYAALKQRVLQGGDALAAAKAAEAAEVAADRDFLMENAPKALERVSEGLRRVAEIVRSMKEFAHPDERQAMPVDLNRAIQTTLVVARNVYKYVAEVETSLGELPLVTCHGGEINEVLLNIVVNAAQAIEERVKGTLQKGRISIASRVEGGRAVIDIADTGGGIPESIRGRVFDPFFTTKEVGKGTGQGLAISRSIIEKNHRGSLDFEVQPGVGTTFHVRLPLQGTPADLLGADPMDEPSLEQPAVRGHTATLSEA